MSCLITKGRNEACKDSIAGIQGVYFENYSEKSDLLFAVDGQISGFTSGVSGIPDLYYYELKGQNSYAETINTSFENGTTFYTQTLTINLKKLTNAMTTELKVLAAGRVRVWIHLTNGETILMGLKRGGDMRGGSIQTGTTEGDFIGYSALVFEAMEKEPGKFVNGSTEDNPFAGFPTAPIIVKES